MKEHRIAILLLAAGESSRMGRMKQLLPWKNGLLINHMIQVAADCSASDITVVLGAHSSTIKRAIHSSSTCSVVENPSWEEGLGATISFAVKQRLLQGSEPDAILIMLCDQPLVDREYLDSLIHSFQQGHGLVATRYGKNLGVPALFDDEFFEQLTHLNSDYGARELLRQNREGCYALDAEEKVRDIDTPDDYKQLLDLQGFK